LRLREQPDGGRRDYALVWTRPETVVPSFQQIASFQDADLQQVLAEVDDFCALIAGASAGCRFLFVPTWCVPTYDRGLGLLDTKPGKGICATLMQMNLRLIANLESVPNVFVLNAQKWIEEAGKAAFNPKVWYMAKGACDPDVFAEAARDVRAALAAVTGNARQ